METKDSIRFQRSFRLFPCRNFRFYRRLKVWTKKLVEERHVNIVAGRATFTDRPPRLYAYVHKQVPSAAARLDWFHIAMKFKAAENSVFGHRAAT